MLSIEKGVDYDGVDEDELPYKHVRTLGHGHSGTVEEVEDQITGKAYARKTIRITGSKSDRVERTRVFRNEVHIIRGLESHPHIISVHATYVTKRVFGILLQPVASEGDLEEFLAEYAREAELEEEHAMPNGRIAAMKLIILQGFGCLAGGLAFMHQKKIRHKDIKPRNILVDKGSFIYTDFGYSFDSNGFMQSTTEGRPDYLTRRYSAPEVLQHDRRNSKSDVYSLGCVFIDMVSALCPSLIIDGISCFAHNMEQLHSQLLHLEVEKGLNLVTEIVVRMTARESSHRICSTHIAKQLQEHNDLCCRKCMESLVPESSELLKHENCIAPPTADTSHGWAFIQVVDGSALAGSEVGSNLTPSEASGDQQEADLSVVRQNASGRLEHAEYPLSEGKVEKEEETDL
ncbi:hypothetical protein HBI24_120320 [Parastagonospora nodorum]|nr:hypothetical protein HBH51_173440 [Parastagonospora nodorum]KAH4101511.1 hypothetical protein HBH46_138490 [Parastagonospora nodorum]KAH4265130.1 hypothetical protein HBI03_081220 [Parastagonospora nodorum]KAH4283174.1 hypothetical protein HBI04_019640 [Parastagonospora nodorum]KAH5122948.1 hypothetical protein HBH71_038270 [Parastagonospora nodorum]